MKWISVLFLAVSWVIWLSARFGGMDELSGWAFVASYAGLAAGFLLASGVSGILREVSRYLGLGFLMLALGEVGWLTFFSNSDGAGGGNVIMPNLPYYISTLLFAVSALKIFKQGAVIFDFPKTWLWGTFAAAFLTVSILTILGLNDNQISLGFITDALDSVLTAFVSLLLIAVAFLTAGGSWSRWMIPLAAGFGLRMLGNVYYTLTASTYAYGSPADWLWLLGSAAIAFLLIREDTSETSVPAIAD